jgi:hypothetical protein
MSHVTIAASEDAFKQVFTLLRDGFTFSKSDSDSFGPFSASYSVAFHLENGTIQLNDDGTVEVNALDVVWDTLSLQVCFNLPGICIPGFCVIPDPWNGCLVGIPGVCIGGPICYPRPQRTRERISRCARAEAKYFIGPDVCRRLDLDRAQERPTCGRSSSIELRQRQASMFASIANVFELVVSSERLPGRGSSGCDHVAPRTCHR